MPPADFFRRFGLLVVRDFLDTSSCAAIRSEIRTAMRAPGQICSDTLHAVEPVTWGERYSIVTWFA